MNSAPGLQRGAGGQAERPILPAGGYRIRETARGGAVVGARYKLCGRMGRGGTADVYLAEDLLTGARVVVKQLSQAALAEPGLRHRFATEAQAIQAISHPSVVRLLDYDAPEEERPYVVMEALSGESLADFLDREGSVPLDLALVICRHAAAGLAAAHRVGVVHRDLKPANLFLVGPPGEPYGLKVIDFGMAKLGGRKGGSGTDTVMGTVQYMPPEQVLADPVDARTDVYSLGIVMFVLFTGHLPFDIAAGVDLVSHQVFSPIPPPTWLDDRLDSRVEAIILRATCKHPDNRYQSMDALLAELDDVVGLTSGSSARHSSPPPIVPDLYQPRNAIGQQAVSMLARKNPRLVPRANRGMTELGESGAPVRRE